MGYRTKSGGVMLSMFTFHSEEVPRDPREFEKLCARLLWEMGYHDVRRIGQPGDMDLDIICRDPYGEKVGVQCKRYSPDTKVGAKEIREFIGALTIHGCQRGIFHNFITASTLTDGAWRTVKSCRNIKVIDGPKLRRKIKRLHASSEYCDGHILIQENSSFMKIVKTL